MDTKKLIEVALPLETINSESVKERSIRHGHPSTLHLWWSRKPTTVARAVLWASLVDDPSSHPEWFPTEEEQNKERQRLFQILSDLVAWENSNNDEVLTRAKAEILKSTNYNPPALLDPFAGGGAIPLEGQRLGLEVYAHDLNPVAVLINKGMIEIPYYFSGGGFVNPDAKKLAFKGEKDLTGLVGDVCYYGKWIKNEAYKRIGQLFPKVKVPEECGGGKATVIAWIWARTVHCPNPACDCIVPLSSSFVLSKKKGQEAWVQPYYDAGLHFKVIKGKYDKTVENGTRRGKKALFCCPFCGEGIINGDYINSEAEKGRMNAQLMAVAAEGMNGRLYITPDEEEFARLNYEVEGYFSSHNIDEKVSPAECRGTFASNAQGRAYGFHHFKDYFTHRQLIALSTFSDLIAEVQIVAEKDAIANGMENDHIPLSSGGKGAKAYSEAIGIYLAFIVDKMADLSNSLNRWEPVAQCPRQMFGRQGISMIWEYAESNLFSNSSGSWEVHLRNFSRCVESDSFCFSREKVGKAKQFDAQSDCGLRNVMISTDPPYYDNVGYADLSDFFYIWLRQSLKGIYPELFKTLLVPKTEELIASPYRHDGNAEKAKSFFENGMLMACQQLFKYANESVPVTIYYAYKQSDNDEKDDGQASSGWETMLSAIINSNFAITGTWPMRTEMASRQVAMGTNALASAIVLVCRKRNRDAAICTRRNFINELKRELRPALKKLQSSNIAPVDLAQSAIGPGMGVYSKYSQVLEADGTPMSVRSALKVINQELDLYFNEQDSDLDSESRFCVDLYSQYAFNEMPFGDANTLATAKNTSVAIMASHGILYAQKGKVHLLERSELPENIRDHESSIWLLCQQLTYRMEKEGVEGCAKVLAHMFGSNGERAKDLAYRLYTIAERKKWAQEAYAYNALVVAWSEIQSRAAELKAVVPEQLSLFQMFDI